MRIVRGKATESVVRKLEQRGSRLDEIEPKVRRIVAEVRKGGDRSLMRYATKWDGLRTKQALRVSEAEIQAGWEQTPPAVRIALWQAAVNIRQFCRWQMPREWKKTTEGAELGQLIRPLASVGCYVPGGRYPLPSTLLMTVIPAQVAGVKRIAVVSPRLQPATLAAAMLLGVSEVYRCGGAQAIAALAYGTETVSRVDKIVGPGNAFVTAAKKLVSFDCAIDMLAGPTEAVLYNDSATPAFLASDIVAQAEHDPDAVVVIVTTLPEFAKQVSNAAESLSRGNETARQAIRKNGYILVAGSRQQAMDWVNRLAPEHLTVSQEDLPAVQNAGSVFVGDYSPQSSGDYAAGPNHVLPTAGAARFRGGLSVHDFLKIITVQNFSRAAMEQIAVTVTTLAEAEGLKAHAQSVRLRCGNA